MVVRATRGVGHGDWVLITTNGPQKNDKETTNKTPNSPENLCPTKAN
jgi:hypothetical protein